MQQQPIKKQINLIKKEFNEQCLYVDMSKVGNMLDRNAIDSTIMQLMIEKFVISASSDVSWQIIYNQRMIT